ncbi:carbonic anhydrase [Nocardioides sp.]|uniref:carbonic anhydrase n=1 Tax=Nocardioides sp. TaxID=35761 RepID=UPI003517E405
MHLRLARRTALGLAAGSVLIGGAAVAATTTPWSYSGATGPSHWGSLDPAYTTCSDGSAQSPIDLAKPVKSDLVNLGFTYPSATLGIFDTGHTIEAEPLEPGADTLTLNNKAYTFAQLHYHAPSEHTINGTHYPLEIHFVHKAADGQLAVVGVLVKQGAENAAWKPITDRIAAATTDPEADQVDVNLDTLLPRYRRSIRYDGSLTTPPCSEGVKWNVLAYPIEMSAAQIAAFTHEYAVNARPTQPRNNRVVRLDVSRDH